MSTRSTTRRSLALRATAGLTVLVAGFAVTACSDKGDSGSKTDGKADTSASAPAEQNSDSKSDGEKDATEGGADAGAKTGDCSQDSGKSSAGSGTTDKSRAVGTEKAKPCDVDILDVGVKPGNKSDRLLLKVTQRAGLVCTLQGYPSLRFDTGQESVPFEETEPQTVVTLKPGQFAYAAIIGVGDESDKPGKAATKVTVSYHHGEGRKTVNLPHAKYVHHTKVTYWQSSASDAQKW
ncbi:DUF4232 domain-containing protein [Streptomyces sp. HNM1019]|uniref:DUF4232 domain-containing protein n=1 Tax=Streptomyces sp. HNM1019 TaxID=3424717 RepID=UPI003D76D288